MRSKKKRFAQISKNQNVLEYGKELFGRIKGNWCDYFGNAYPLVVELACGRGEYTTGMARLFDNKNFIGVDIKGDRIWKGSTVALEEGLYNVAFLRTQILLLEDFFEENEIDDLWITFPDPRPRDRDIRRRLTSPRYIDIYKRLLADGGTIKLKTDNTGLFEYTLGVLAHRNDICDLAHTDDLYNSNLRLECHDIKTKYEEKFHSKGQNIKYLKFKFN